MEWQTAIIELANKFTKDNPFENTGVKFECDVFIVRSYYWGDDENICNLPNFEWKTVEINWYKHCKRGFIISNPYNLDAATMLAECLAALQTSKEQVTRPS